MSNCIGSTCKPLDKIFRVKGEYERFKESRTHFAPNLCFISRMFRVNLILICIFIIIFLYIDTLSFTFILNKYIIETIKFLILEYFI